MSEQEPVVKDVAEASRPALSYCVIRADEDIQTAEAGKMPVSSDETWLFALVLNWLDVSENADMKLHGSVL